MKSIQPWRTCSELIFPSSFLSITRLCARGASQERAIVADDTRPGSPSAQLPAPNCRSLQLITTATGLAYPIWRQRVFTSGPTLHGSQSVWLFQRLQALVQVSRYDTIFCSHKGGRCCVRKRERSLLAKQNAFTWDCFPLETSKGQLSSWWSIGVVCPNQFLGSHDEFSVIASMDFFFSWLSSLGKSCWLSSKVNFRRSRQEFERTEGD